MELKKCEVPAERKEITVEGGIPDGFHCEQLTNAQNTLVWTKERYQLPRDFSWAIVPRTIVERVKLNMLGLNGLATNIFSPDAYPTIGCLQAVLVASNKIEGGIGLPPSDDLIIRTRRIKRSSDRDQKYVAPALLVTNLSSGKPGLRVLNYGRVGSVDEFYEMLPPGSFLMAHPDNVDLQKKAIHGNFIKMDNPPVVEGMFGTNMLHARALSEELSSDQKTVVVTHLLHLKAQGDNLFGLPTYVRGSATGLYGDVIRMQNAIEHAYSEVTKHFGRNVMMEFRRYRLGLKMPFHVLDAMPWEKRFERDLEGVVSETENVRGD